MNHLLKFLIDLNLLFLNCNRSLFFMCVIYRIVINYEQICIGLFFNYFYLYLNYYLLEKLHNF